jgi:hypothetical protein
MNTSDTKRYLFEVTDTEEGLQVTFDSFEDPEGKNPLTIVDASMIMLTLAKVLRDSGLKDEDLKDFMLNIYKFAIGDVSEEDSEIKEIEEIEPDPEE